ncbi:hypothetical protein RFI_22924, partial [Reticulomyxa filosa]
FININNMSNQSFQTLKELPIPLDRSQCVLHKHELLICGGYQQRACYSYNTLKNEYKFICEYPSDIDYMDTVYEDRDQATLLSFGGYYKHSLVMKYVSVWSNISNKSDQLNNYNEWVSFTDNQNHPIIIGKDQGDYQGVRAVIGGSNSHLLFITYPSYNISVFNLNTFQFIKHDILPTNYYIYYHCFVSNSENGQGQEMMKTNKQNDQILLFCKNTGLSIEYDEDNNTFQFHHLPVCKDLARLNRYAYVCTNGAILFFGGWNGYYGTRAVVSKSVYKYSIQENKWMTLQNTLPSPLYNCVTILIEEDNHVHIIGGQDDKETAVLTHMKTKMRLFDHSLLVMICLFICFDETQIMDK